MAQIQLPVRQVSTVHPASFSYTGSNSVSSFFQWDSHYLTAVYPMRNAEIPLAHSEDQKPKLCPGREGAHFSHWSPPGLLHFWPHTFLSWLPSRSDSKQGVEGGFGNAHPQALQLLGDERGCRSSGHILHGQPSCVHLHRQPAPLSPCTLCRLPDPLPRLNLEHRQHRPLPGPSPTALPYPQDQGEETEAGRQRGSPESPGWHSNRSNGGEGEACRLHVNASYHMQPTGCQGSSPGLPHGLASGHFWGQ